MISVGSLALVTVYLINGQIQQDIRASLTHSLDMAWSEYHGRGRQIQLAMQQAATEPALQRAISYRNEEVLRRLINTWAPQTPDIDSWWITDPSGRVLVRLNGSKSDPGAPSMA